MRKPIRILFLLSLAMASCSPLAGDVPPETKIAAEPLASATLDLPDPTPTTAPGRPLDLELSSDIAGPPMDGCTMQTALRPPDATEASLFPAVSSTDWRSGPDDASTTIVEYGDFQ